MSAPLTRCNGVRGDDMNFCTQCGAKLAGGRFCRQCGGAVTVAQPLFPGPDRLSPAVVGAQPLLAAEMASSGAPALARPVTAGAETRLAGVAANLMQLIGVLAATELLGTVVWVAVHEFWRRTHPEGQIIWWSLIIGLLLTTACVVGVVVATRLASSKPSIARALGAAAVACLAADSIVSVAYDVHIRYQQYGYYAWDFLLNLALSPHAWVGLVLAPLAMIVVLLGGLPRRADNPIGSIERCLREFVRFEGRSGRADFLWMLLAVNGISAVLLWGWLPSLYQGSVDSENMIFPIAQLVLCTVLQLVLTLPCLAVQIRRLHDTDKSGVLLLIALIPFGQLILLVLLLLPGTPGPNRYGPQPAK